MSPSINWAEHWQHLYNLFFDLFITGQDQVKVETYWDVSTVVFCAPTQWWTSGDEHSRNILRPIVTILTVVKRFPSWTNNFSRGNFYYNSSWINVRQSAGNKEINVLLWRCELQSRVNIYLLVNSTVNVTVLQSFSSWLLTRIPRRKV